MKLKAASFLSLLVLVFMSATAARAQEEEQTSQPPKYRMELILLADSDVGEPEYIFLLGAVGFRTVEGLKKFVATLPHGTVIEWAPGCIRLGGEPLLSSAEEMKAWMEFCEEHGIKFILHPSG